MENIEKRNRFDKSCEAERSLYNLKDPLYMRMSAKCPTQGVNVRECPAKVMKL